MPLRTLRVQQVQGVNAAAESLRAVSVSLPSGRRCAGTDHQHKPQENLPTSLQPRSPGIIPAGRAQADSSVRADSWRYSPESEGPGRKAGTPHPGWPGCWGGWTGSCQESQIGFSAARHGRSFLWEPHGLEKSSSHPTVRGSTGTNTFFLGDLIPSKWLLATFPPCTCSRAVGLAEVARGRHRGHHEVEGDGNVHGSDVAGAGTDHPDLVVGLEVHVGWAPWERGKSTGIAGILNNSRSVPRPDFNGVEQLWKRTSSQCQEPPAFLPRCLSHTWKSHKLI